MLLRHFAVLILCLCGGLVLLAGTETHEERNFSGFYVVTHVVSDASPFRYEHVLDVKPQGTDVLVREIRIAPLNSSCPGVTVKAADHLVKHTSHQENG